MKKMLEEYGLIIVVICLILMTLSFSTGAMGKSIMNDLSDKTEKITKLPNWPDEEEDNNYISKTESFIGNYADVDGDGTVDGIIFADLAFDGSGTWNPSGYSWAALYGNYSYSAVSASSLKDYYVSQESYINALGKTAKVISPIKGTSGKDRFYVMALTNTNSFSCRWYNSACTTKISDYSTITSENFGTGKANTETMISKWNSSAYGAQNSDDLWGQIQTQASKGWFVPSRAEWAAFGANLNVVSTNYNSKRLSDYYWSSSLRNTGRAYGADFYDDYMDSNSVNGGIYVRLATTF